MLDDATLWRYQSQINLPSVDLDGQEAISRAKILVIGMGGLGCHVAPALVGAGISKLTLVDDDTVAVHNLPRQTLFSEVDVGAYKVQCAQAKLSAMNPACHIDTHTQRLPYETLKKTIVDYDLVMDCTDNIDSRLLLNRVSLETQIPWIMGAAIRQEGQYAIFDPTRSQPCYACLMGGQTPRRLSCSEAGVFGPVVGMVGQAQALLALQYLSSPHSLSYSKMFYLDGQQHQLHAFNITPNGLCECHSATHKTS
ncbi:MAG: HesA/MoeB/ThiF family protein [Glaciecola sp.]|jgi:adenylyltransferase/sulfurtransferase